MQTHAKHSPQMDQNDKEKFAPQMMGKNDLEGNRSLPNQNCNGDTSHGGTLSNNPDAFLVTFGPDDIENPLNWSIKLKWSITAAISGTGFLRIMVSTVRNHVR